MKYALLCLLTLGLAACATTNYTTEITGHNVTLAESGLPKNFEIRGDDGSGQQKKGTGTVTEKSPGQIAIKVTMDGQSNDMPGTVSIVKVSGQVLLQDKDDNGLFSLYQIKPVDEKDLSKGYNVLTMKLAAGADKKLPVKREGGGATADNFGVTPEKFLEMIEFENTFESVIVIPK